MARKEKPAKAAKEPGRLKQMWQVFQMTRRHDSAAVWWMLLGFIGPIALSILAALFLTTGNVLGFVLWILAGVLAGVLVAIIILGRRAERAAYDQIAGQPGAVGAVFRSSLGRSWRGNEMPINASPKTQDAVYRAVGKGGVVLVAEGPRSRTKRLIEDEKRKVNRILPNVPVNTLFVGPDDDSVPLYKLAREIKKIRRPKLTKPEVLAVSNRLASLGNNTLPIPKGVDPMKVRAQRSR